MSEEQKKKTLGIAVGSMVCGLFFLIPFLGFLLSLIALVLGIIALIQISKNKDTSKGNGFAVTGIVLGAIGILIIPIIAILAAIAIPRFISLKLAAQQAQCEGAAASIDTALSSYSSATAAKNDSESRFPQSIHDPEFLQYLAEQKLPSHPFEKDWNDYYDPQQGRINSKDACGAIKNYDNDTD